jgi:hypothetical protein
MVSKKVSVRAIINRKWVICTWWDFIFPVESVSEVRLAILNCLGNILGRTKPPCPYTIRELGLLQLSAEVYVRVPH